MAEEAEKEVDAENLEGSQEEKPKSKLPLIIGGVVGLLVLGGAGAYFAGVFNGSDDAHAAEEAPAEPETPPTFVDFDEILVNLNEPGRKGKFLKLKLKFEVSDPEAATAIENLRPRIVDQYQMYLRELRLEDLQGSEGLHRLREELLRRVNQEVKPFKVNDVLFMDVLIQ